MPEVLVTIGLLMSSLFIGILIAQSDSASSRVSDVNSAAPETKKDIKGY
jgi:hypothetical protein